MFNVLEPYMRYNNPCVCKNKYMPPMLNFFNVGRSSCWPCSYMVPRWAGSPMLRKLCSIFFYKKKKTIDTTPVLWASLAVN